MAALAGAWSTRFFPAPEVAIRAAVQMLLTVRGLPRAAWWIWAIASSVNSSAVREPANNDFARNRTAVTLDEQVRSNYTDKISRSGVGSGRCVRGPGWRQILLLVL
jgi:hypothetical protein